MELEGEKSLKARDQKVAEVNERDAGFEDYYNDEHQKAHKKKEGKSEFKPAEEVILPRGKPGGSWKKKKGLERIRSDGAASGRSCAEQRGGQQYTGRNMIKKTTSRLAR